MKTTTLPALLLTLTVPLGLGLSGCGDTADADSGSSDDTSTSSSTSSDPSDGDSTETETDDANPPGAGSFEAGSDEQVEAIRDCFTYLGLSVIDTPAPLRPEQRLSIEPIPSGPDKKLEGQVYVFDSPEQAEEERPNVTFFDEDTEYDSLVGNVLVVYYPAPSRAGGLEAGIDACLA